MTTQHWTNSATTTLNGAITNVATSLIVHTGDGALFPTTGPFRIKIGTEIIEVGSRSTDTFSSLTRGVESTSAASHADTAAVSGILTAGQLGLLHQVGVAELTNSDMVAANQNPMTTQDDIIVAGSSGTPARLAKGSDGQVLTVDPTTHHLVYATPTSGGNVTSTTAFGSEPGSPASGDLDLTNNGIYLERYSGSAWAPFGPIYPLTTPPTATGGPSSTQFGWVNQGSMAVDSTNGEVYLTGYVDNTDTWRGLCKTAPATPYIVDVLLDPLIMAQDFQGFGVGWKASGTGNLVLLYNIHNSTMKMNVGKANTTTITANYLSDININEPFRWFRIADDGANRTCSVSIDGQHWWQIHSVGRTDYITADQLFVGVENRNANYPTSLAIQSWHEH